MLEFILQHFFLCFTQIVSVRCVFISYQRRAELGKKRHLPLPLDKRAGLQEALKSALCIFFSRNMSLRITRLKLDKYLET